MIDTETHERIAVLADGTAGPYFLVPLDQLGAVEAVLRRGNVAYWVDADAISIDGKPEITVVNFGRGADADRIQRLLDAAQ